MAVGARAPVAGLPPAPRRSVRSRRPGRGPRTPAPLRCRRWQRECAPGDVLGGARHRRRRWGHQGIAPRTRPRHGASVAAPALHRRAAAADAADCRQPARARAAGRGEQPARGGERPGGRTGGGTGARPRAPARGRRRGGIARRAGRGCRDERRPPQSAGVDERRGGGRVPDMFTLAELVRLGSSPPPRADALGTPTQPFDTRLGVAWRPAEAWESYSGRPSLGLLAASTPELPLRLADCLSRQRCRRRSIRVCSPLRRRICSTAPC